MTSSSSTRPALEAALSRAASAPTDADAFLLFLEALGQAAPALVGAGKASGRGDNDGDGAIDGDSNPSSSPSLLLHSPESRSAYDLAMRSALSRAMASALQNGEPVMEHDASGTSSNSSAAFRNSAKPSTYQSAPIRPACGHV